VGPLHRSTINLPDAWTDLEPAIDDGSSAVLAMPPSLLDILRDRAQPVRGIMVEVRALLDLLCKLFQFGDGAFVKIGR
jgi:hypothetical protein